MRKKLLSITLTLAMVISLLSGITLTAHAAYGGGKGTVSSPYLISTAAQLAEFRAAVNNGSVSASQHFALTQDIDLQGSASNKWEYMGTFSNPFRGTLDGKNHTIKGLYINDSIGGFFWYNEGTIKNLRIEGDISSSREDGKGQFAGLCKENKGVIDNCVNLARVHGGEECAGICALNYSTVSNCYNDGEISGGLYVGGICAVNSGKITNCANRNQINTGSTDIVTSAGGICADNTGAIDRCYNIDKVDGGKTGTAGGICGVNSASYPGNGEQKIGRVTNSYNVGTVLGEEWFDAGGICGVNGAATYATDALISNCYNYGIVSTTVDRSSSEEPHDICGWNTAQMKGCYYVNHTVIGEFEGPELSREQFKNLNNFVGWDRSIWTMSEKYERPVLISNPELGRGVMRDGVTSSINGTVGTPYTYSAASVMGLDAEEYTFEHVAGFKPAGLKFDGEDFTQDGIIEGTPQAAGYYPMFIRATNESGKSVLKLIYIVIVPGKCR